MVADHAEGVPATAVEDRLVEDRTGVVDCVGIAEGVVEDRTAGVVGYNFEEHNWDDSFEVPRAEVEEAVVDHAEGRFEVGLGEDHVAGDDDYSATEDHRNRLVDHPGGQAPVDQELEVLNKVRDCGDRMEQVDLEEDPVVAGRVEHLDHVVDHCSHYVGRAQHENHHVHLDYHLCRLEGHHRRVEVAAHIRTEDAAAGRSLQEGGQEVEEGEGSCIDLTYSVEGVRFGESRR